MNTRQHIFGTLALAAALCTPSAHALHPKEHPDTFLVPQRAVVVSGDHTKAGSLLAILYDTSELHFTEPSAPRFLFLDREGKVAFGIGGYLKGTLQYDFDGSTDTGSSFITYDIPVPNNGVQRSQFYGNANHSTIFLQLVGKSSRFGYYQMYIQTNFSGNGTTGYGLKLKQAYLKVGYVTAGLTNSTFVDGAAGTPVIDDQGPSGEMSRKNVLLRYAPRFSDHLSAAISIEMPSVSYTTDDAVKKINPRVPDIPLYLQYEWNGGKSHVRLSGLFRDLYYRNVASGKNCNKIGWAAQLSGIISLTPRLTLLYQGAYGRGYGAYVNDLSGFGMDLVYSGTSGKMEAPRMANFELGARYNVTPNLFFAGTYSQARTFGIAHLGADTYRYGQYISLSGFYDIFSDLRIGLQYLRGDRADYDRRHGHANSLMGMLQYNF